MLRRSETLRHVRNDCGSGSSTPATPCSPLPRTGEHRRKPGADVTLYDIELQLDEEDGIGEVGTSEVSTSEIGADHVGGPQVGTSHVRANEVCPPQAGPSQICVPEVGADEVSSPVVLPVPDFGPDKLARGQEQGIDIFGELLTCPGPGGPQSAGRSVVRS